MTAPDDAEEIIFFALVLDHGHEMKPGGMDCRACRRRAKKILHALDMNDLQIVSVPRQDEPTHRRPEGETRG